MPLFSHLSFTIFFTVTGKIIESHWRTLFWVCQFIVITRFDVTIDSKLGDMDREPIADTE